MKITKKQLVKIIKETIYVDKKGTAVTSAQARDITKKKNKTIAQSDPRLKQLIHGSKEDHLQARELGPPLGIVSDYHGAEEMYTEDPYKFMGKDVAPYDPDEFGLILFEMYCGYEYENSELDESLFQEITDYFGLIYGKIILPWKDKVPVHYFFGPSKNFEGDIENFLERIIPDLDNNYSSYGINRPCEHKISFEKTYNLGRPSSPTNREILKKFLIQNYKGLKKEELLVLKTILPSPDLNSLSKIVSDYHSDYLMASDIPYIIDDITHHFMAHVAEVVIGYVQPGIKGGIVEKVQSKLTYTTNPGELI